MAASPPEVLRKELSQRATLSVDDSSLTPAAVLVVLYDKDGEYCVLLNKRSEEVEYHKGEISFPGGARDPEDTDFVDTALRETEEEMGVNRQDVTVLGELDEVVTRSRFHVKVFVGSIDYPYNFKPSAVEIAEVLEVPIPSLNDPSNWRVETRLEAGAFVSTRSYAYNEHIIFGVTARILQQFLEVLADGLEKEAP
jgi:8-oxo-dGTP pyrophosphatase MutT (NUDIX family)